MKDGIETVIHQSTTYAIIVRQNYTEPGIHFLTPNKLSQQLAFMKYPKGKEIPAHTHNSVPREASYTLEALFIRKGKLRVDFYTDTEIFLESRVLQSGDVILLCTGGHGFEVLEEIEMIEVKQGPYTGSDDRVRFTAKTK